MYLLQERVEYFNPDGDTLITFIKLYRLSVQPELVNEVHSEKGELQGGKE